MKVRNYKVWSQEEEDALREGVTRHGLGAWEVIKSGSKVLQNRTGVQLKDKWRNLVKFKHVTSDDLCLIQANTRTNKSSPRPGRKAKRAKAGKSGVARTPPSAAEATTSAAKEEESFPPPSLVVDRALALMTKGGLGQGCSGSSKELEIEGPTYSQALQEAWNGREPLLGDPGPVPSTSSDCENVAHAKGNGAANGTKRGEGRKRSRRPSVKEDRRFGIYDERRYNTTAATTSDALSSLPHEPQDAGASLPDANATATAGAACNGCPEGHAVLETGLAKVKPRQVGGGDVGGPHYPLKKNGFKKPKIQDGPTSSSECCRGRKGRCIGAGVEAKKWDRKALPPKKAAAALMKKEEAKTEEVAE